MSDKYEKAIECVREDLEQIFQETTEALEHVTKAQAELVCKATEVMTRGYVGMLNGTVGAIMYGYAGFLDGYSRAWKRKPNKKANEPPAAGGATDKVGTVAQAGSEHKA